MTVIKAVPAPPTPAPPSPVSKKLRVDGFKLCTLKGNPVEVFMVDEGIAYGRVKADDGSWTSVQWWAEDGTCNEYTNYSLLKDGPKVVFATKKVSHESANGTLTASVLIKWEDGKPVSVELA